MNDGGISSTWWVTRTRAGASRSAASSPSRRDEVLAAAEVQAGGRLVEQHQLGVGHQGAGDLHPLALALADSVPKRRSARCVDPERVQQLVGAGVVERVVLLAPAPDDAVGRGDHDVADQLVGRGCRSAIAALARPMRGRSSKTSTAPSTSPRTPATPVVGCMRPAASCSSVVLPAPFGPSMTQRSPSSTSQVTSSRSAVVTADHADAGECEDVAHCLAP